MEHITQALAEFSHRGIVISADHDRLDVDAPKGALSEADKQFLTAHKTELLTHFQTVVNSSVHTVFCTKCQARLQDGICHHCILSELSPALVRLYHQYPPIIEDVPLLEILSHTDEADYEDLQDQEMLRAFARALVASGMVGQRTEAHRRLRTASQVFHQQAAILRVETLTSETMLGTNDTEHPCSTCNSRYAP